MRRTAIVVAVVVLLVTAANGVAADATALKSEREKTSYALGVEVGSNLKRQGVDLDAALIAQGLRDVLTGGTLLLGEAEVRAAVMAFQKELMAKQQEAQKAVSAKAKAEGEAFLAANATKDGVVTLPSGLQYKVITPGSGASPKASDTVSVHYRGRLIDGTEFDSSYKRNEPTSFPVGGVIPGWTEALQLMKVGAKWELYVPAKLAYGDRGAGGLIPPGATLVFEVELLSIK
jgi:FKBP-type peptidyl-prolyl cis-trans isomerase FklB